MLKKIVKGYAAVLLAFLRFVALMIVCIGTGFIVVYPLWKLADTSPSTYTLVFILLFLAVLIYFAGNRIRLAFLHDGRRFLMSVLRKATILAGIGTGIALVLNYQRAAAGAVILASLAIYGFLAFVVSPNLKKSGQ